MRFGFAYNIPIAVTPTAGRPTPKGVIRCRVSATNSCYIAIGPNAVASVNGSTLLSGGISGEEISVFEGEVISVIGTSAGGFMNITELN